MDLHSVRFVVGEYYCNQDDGLTLCKGISYFMDMCKADNVIPLNMIKNEDGAAILSEYL
jgi:hypothetical protein